MASKTCGEVNPDHKRESCTLPIGHAGDHMAGSFAWRGFANPLVNAPRGATNGTCAHINKQYFVGSGATRRQGEVLCELPANHPGDHYAQVDIEGQPVVNGYWGDPAGLPAPEV